MTTATAARAAPIEPGPAPGEPDPAPAAAEPGLPGLESVLAGEDARAYAALRRELEARWGPIDAAERTALEAIAAAMWRRQRLAAVEERLLRALTEGRPVGGLPSLHTIIRYRARIERDRELAEAELRRLQALRPKLPSFEAVPAQLEWLARQIRAGKIKPRTAQSTSTGEAATRAAGEAPPPPASPARPRRLGPFPPDPSGLAEEPALQRLFGAIDRLVADAYPRPAG
ncbi:MAG: hypothetical protein N3D77_04780 [Geminicoccaceae bacterium]|nr:hypothetical protein [Geminicoccaceae bacterium]